MEQMDKILAAAMSVAFLISTLQHAVQNEHIDHYSPRTEQ